MYDCELLNVYIYLVFVGNGCLALVPSHLPHLRLLCLQACDKVCDEYVDKLVAAVPELKVIKLGDIVGAVSNKHLETTYKFFTLDTFGIIRHCALPDQSENCNCYN